MEKKKILVYSIMLSAGVFAVVLFVLIGGSSGSGNDSSGMSIGTYFVLFILPVIIAQQNKKKEQKGIEQQNYKESL
ncbi:MAG: hypothetical protein ACXABO_12105 [Promethearchaeota archaeon]|jgi:hypothetical protein